MHRKADRRRPEIPEGLSLALNAPAAALRWHPTKNGDLTPRDVSPGSHRRVWWKCRKGPDHEWQAIVASVANAVRSGCPFCSGQRASVTNSLASLTPAIARQWHPTRNGGLTPRDVTAYSNRPVWWRCRRGPDHEWQAPPNNRQRGDGCPFCSRHRPTAATSLAARFPDIAREWHPTKNGSLSPRAVLPASQKKIWWICRRDPRHEWQAVVSSRKAGTGCPYCSGHRLTPENSLAAQDPRLARQWHPSKNGFLRPADISWSSGRSVWWRCPRGPDHEWLARISLRAAGRGCPFCAGRKIGDSNSLAARFPEIAARWHPTRNGRLRPTDVAPQSGRKVWWKCSVAHDHEWEAVISSAHRTGCPFCAHKRPSSTYSLALTHPAIARQWHPTANGGLTAKDVLPGSRTPRWWLCVSGHSWRAEPQARTYSPRQRQCPYCRLRRRRPVTKRVGERVLLPSDFT